MRALIICEENVKAVKKAFPNITGMVFTTKRF